MSAISALIIGAGRFGAHYPKVLAELNRRPAEGVARIGNLIVTRTEHDRGLWQARQLASQWPETFTGIIGEKAAEADDVSALLATYQPHLVCIAARDPVIGDRIHAQYAQLTVPHAAVLCEKPFMEASGDGRSLKAVQSLKSLGRDAFFALELPMAALPLWQHPIRMQRFAHAHKIDIVWEKETDGPTPLLDDLILHAWSLLPAECSIEIGKVDIATRQANVTARIHSPQWPIAEKSCRIHLGIGGRRRMMRLDGVGWSFDFKNGRLHAMPIDENPRYSQNQADAMQLSTENPLRQHLTALLRGRPLVNLDRTASAQLFLERLYGYTGR